MINIAILEEKDILSNRFWAVLSKWNYVSSASVFNTRQDFQQAMLQSFYDVLLVDLDFADDCILDVIRLMSKLHPKTAVIVISERSDSDTVVDCIKAGASGYLLKGDTTFGVKTAIVEVLNRGAPLSPIVAMHLLKRISVAPSFAQIHDRAPSRRLTKRECDVITLFSKGLSIKDVSLEMGISEKTVPVHLRNIYKKLGTSTRKQAVIEARHLGLVH